MAEILKGLQEYPDVSFIEGTSFQQLQEQMIRDYEKRYRELTGKEGTLAQADPYRLILYSCAVAIYQAYQYGDKAGKMGLLKYSTGEFLDNLAALKRVSRKEAQAAATTLRFTLSAAVNRDLVIPEGIRVKGMELYFETMKKGMIPAGELSVDVPARCQSAGREGNGFLPGDIRTLVDPLPYTLEVENITETEGGADRETDEELAERVYLAPAGYSTAGPKAAYEYWVRTYDNSVSECMVTSEEPGEVDIYLTVDGGLPGEEFIRGLEEYLEDGARRPLTDRVVVKPPETVEYEIEFTYYIRTGDRGREESIKAAVEGACREYIAWQKKIGRDVTPAQLVCEVMKAGAQSVEVKKPAYMELEAFQMAVTKEPAVIYGGLRDG